MEGNLHFRKSRPSNCVKMRSRGVLILLFLVAAEAKETTPKSPPSLDLTAEESGLDYPKQFGMLRNGPLYAHHHWSPYQPSYHQDHSRIDPYVVYLFTRYARFLPQGLGLYGIYGSTGLPHTKPPGVFAFPHRDK